MSRRRAAIWTTAGLLALPALASAHVAYLVRGSAFASRDGQDWPFLLGALAEPRSWVAIFLAAAAACAAYALWREIPWLAAYARRVGQRADTYGPLTPWMLRLGLGIALIGAGVSQNLFTPALPNFASVASLEVIFGFLLMAGLLVVPAATGVVVLFAFAASASHLAFGSLEFLGAALAILALDNERPGLDDLLGVQKVSPFGWLRSFAPLFLRLGIGGAMIYSAFYEKLLNPHAAELVVSQFHLTDVVPVSPAMWVLGAGVTELAIGLALALGFRTRLAAALAFAVLSASFFYFREDVSSHIVMFGVLAVLFVTQGGRKSLDHRWKLPEGELREPDEAVPEATR